MSHSTGAIAWTHRRMQAALASHVPLAHVDPVGQIHVPTQGRQWGTFSHLNHHHQVRKKFFLFISLALPLLSYT